MKELEDLAASVREHLQLEYDEASVIFLEGFIERQRIRYDRESRQGLVNSLASFLGQCIIVNYGGHWEWDEEMGYCVVLNKDNKIFPFAKVSKQFENGLEDSVRPFYQIIPAVFKLK